MKVPYAKKWQKETDKLRQIALDCDLTEELKWGKPCFTFLKKNVAIVIPLKESCAFSFFKGALLKDPKHILERIGEHTQAGRWIKFTSLREIVAQRAEPEQVTIPAPLHAESKATLCSMLTECQSSNPPRFSATTASGTAWSGFSWRSVSC